MKRIYMYEVILFILTGYITSLNSQTQTFIRIYDVGTGYTTNFYYGYIIGGESQNAGYAFRTNYDGNVLWSIQSGTGSDPDAFFGSYFDVGQNILYLIGETGDYQQGNRLDILIEKRDPSNGGLIQRATLESSFWGDEWIQGKWICGNSSTGDIFILGIAKDAVTHGKDFYIAKIDQNLNLIWDNLSGTIGDYEYLADGELTYTNIYAVGTAERDMGSYLQDDIYIVKWDYQGNEIFHKYFGQSGQTDHEWGTGICFVNGHIYISGYKEPNTGIIIKMDQSGNIVWSRELTGIGRFTDITPSGEGDGIVVCGYFPSSTYDIELIKFDYTGNIIWQRIFDYQNQNDYAYSVRPLGSSGYVITGSSGGNVIVIKTDSHGLPIEEELINKNDHFHIPTLFSKSSILKIPSDMLIEGILTPNGRKIFYLPLQKHCIFLNNFPYGVYLLKFKSQKDNSVFCKKIILMK